MPIALPAEENRQFYSQYGVGLSSEAFDALAEKNLAALQQNFLLDIVTNAGRDELLSREVAYKLRIPCSEKYFSVCVLAVRSDTPALGREILRILLRDSIAQTISEMDGQICFFVDPQGLLNCVFNSFDPNPRSKLETAVADARTYLSGIIDLHLFFAVGPTVESLSRLYFSRSEALAELLQDRVTISTSGRVFESGLFGRYTFSVQEQLMKYFLEKDSVGLNQTLRGHIQQLQADEGKEKTLSERFLFSYLKEITGYCTKHGVSVERFENYLPAVLCLLQSNIDGSLDIICKLSEQLINHLSTHRTSENNHLLSLAKDYVRDHIADEKLNLEAVSNHIGLSRVYFCKLFHRMEGISFSAYLKKIRIEKAKQLLLTTNLKIFEISSAVGFSHAKYFGQVFKQEVGVTPMEFQKQL